MPTILKTTAIHGHHFENQKQYLYKSQMYKIEEKCTPTKVDEKTVDTNNVEEKQEGKAE